MTEEITPDTSDLDIEIEVNDEGLNEFFDPTQIRIDTRKITIDLILQRIKHDELDLAPDFQRRPGIWTNEAKSRLIESILIRIPLPAFYIDATDDDRWVVIDGLQRLTALKQFLLDTEKPLRLTGLQYFKELEDTTYEQLHRKYQRRILETELILSTIEPGTPPAVKYNIFRRINTGGVPLSPQEIRNALNQGKSTKLLRDLAQLSEFITVTQLDKSKKQERMVDQEFVLGFLAYYLQGYEKYSQFASRDMFFSETMKQLNQNLTEEQSQKIKQDFKRAMQAAYSIFGDNAFRKISRKASRRYPLNQALFEAWSTTLARLNDSQIDYLIEHKTELLDKFTELIDHDPDFSRSISQASEQVKIRFINIQQLVQDILP
ncbi:DUF262 domain-containing protein [Spirulina subsalsa FACHB-351]|uniref:DUF262 domain-containing protein n=1 Tax=Spirulina subsalsa FACHB-351 TaxID=234711 RepID=A0ABT3L361_9CYAN|nr:DUF262 domain-containing protein [Spirulina subsalsa]MCW6035529.1 DUF262 domain-containing protein [Spirulina subsalsa FACHB-351]